MSANEGAVATSGSIHLEMSSEHIAVVTAARASKLNAFTIPMWGQLADTFDRLSASDTVRCVVLRGEGERAFSVGADIGDFAKYRQNKTSAREFQIFSHRAFNAMASCPHPIVASINGVCAGGGIELAVLADLRIAGTSSRFGIPIKRLGLVTSYQEVRTLLAIVGPAVAKELLLEGQMIDAAAALRVGLVNRIVDDDRVHFESLATAQRIAEGAPLAARWHKKFIDRLTTDASPLTEQEIDEVYDCFDTEDYQIGFQSFLGKQKPVFKGR